MKSVKIEFGQVWDFYGPSLTPHKRIVSLLKKILSPKKFKALKQTRLPSKHGLSESWDWFYDLRDAFNDLPKKDRKGWYLRSIGFLQGGGDDCMGLFLERKIKIDYPKAVTKIMSNPCWIIDGEDE